MSFLDKLKFWKREDPFHVDDMSYTPPSADLGLGKDSTPGLGGTPDLGTGSGRFRSSGYQAPTGMGSAGEMHGVGEHDYGLKPTSLEQEQGFTQTQQRAPGRSIDRRDMEVISAKLDAIRASLDSVNARLNTMEHELTELKRRGGW